MSTLNVLITCVGGVFSLDTIRALRLDTDLNVRVIGVDADPGVVNRWFVDSFHQVPNASTDPEAFADALMEVCQGESVDVVVPGADEEVYALSRVKKAFLDAGVKCAAEDWDKVALMRDKVQFFKRLSQSNIPLPKFATASTPQDIATAVPQLGYPGRRVILKPRTGRGARGLIVIDSEVDEYTTGSEARGYAIGNLDRVTENLSEVGGDLGLMAMEYLPGAIFDVDCVARDGVPLCIVPRRRLWDTPFSRGVEGHQIERNQEIERLTEQITAALSLNYVFDCDFGTTADGRPGLLELNPRWSGSVAAGLAGGVNVPGLLVRSMMGLPVPAVDLRFGGKAFPVTRMAFATSDSRQENSPRLDIP